MVEYNRGSRLIALVTYFDLDEEKNSIVIFGVCNESTRITEKIYMESLQTSYAAGLQLDTSQDVLYFGWENQDEGFSLAILLN